MYLSKFRLRTNESTSPRFTRGHRHTPISQPVKTFISHCGQDTAPPDVDIGLLIGRNVPAAFQPIKVIFGNDEEPWAEQYKFGLIIIGCVCKDKHPTPNAASVNRVTMERAMLLHRCEELASVRSPICAWEIKETKFTLASLWQNLESLPSSQYQYLV